MATREIRLDHRMIGGQHVFTSPDLPELWVTHQDLETAKSEIEPVLRAIMRVKGRANPVMFPRTMTVADEAA